MATADTTTRTRPVLRGLSLLFYAASALVLIAAWAYGLLFAVMGVVGAWGWTAAAATRRPAPS